MLTRELWVYMAEAANNRKTRKSRLDPQIGYVGLGD